MKKRYSVSRSWLLGIGFAGSVFWLAGAAPFASTQFKLPKLPKLPKAEKKEPEPSKKAAASAHEAPEIVSITPDSFPPGGSGEVVLTGRNFFRGMRFKLGCQGDEEDPRMLRDHVAKVESPERAVVRISIPFQTPEGACTLYSVGYWGKAGLIDAGETAESPGGTPEILQMKSAATFSISNASKVPVSVPVALLGEGDLGYMDLMMKMQQTMMPGFGEKGEKTLLQMSSDAVKCVQGAKTLFSEPTSGVKEVGEMSMQGQSMGIFRIVFKNGKIYNFMGVQGESSQDEKQVYQIVKKKLGK